MVPPHATSRGVGRSHLPVPQDLGGGNPFMILFPTLLMQYRGGVKRDNMDYNDPGMHFDKMVHRHLLQWVLQHARAPFAEYLQLGVLLISSITDGDGSRRINVFVLLVFYL